MNWRHLSLVVIVLAAGVAAGSFAASRRSIAASSLSSSSKEIASPVADELVRAPDGVATTDHPVVWFLDDTDDHLLVAYDWQGRRAGAMRVASTEPFGVMQSPDGTALVLQHAKPADTSAVIGQARGAVVWARDDSHLCVFLTHDAQPYVPVWTRVGDNGMTTSAVPSALFLLDPRSGTTRRVTSGSDFSPEAGPVILSCSEPNDRAIIGDSSVGITNDVRAITLQDGVASGAGGVAAAGTSAVRGIVASPDATLVAVGSTASTWVIGPSIALRSSFDVRDAGTGKTLATVPGQIVAFSDDDSRALTVSYLGNSSERGIYSLVDWRTGETLWSQELPTSEAVARPHSGDFMIEPFERRPPADEIQPLNAYTRPFIVHENGTTTRLPDEVRPLND
jgi:hypothetical protein